MNERPPGPSPGPWNGKGWPCTAPGGAVVLKGLCTHSLIRSARRAILCSQVDVHAGGSRQRSTNLWRSLSAWETAIWFEFAGLWIT